jgi:hypothetical protein
MKPGKKDPATDILSRGSRNTHSRFMSLKLGINTRTMNQINGSVEGFLSYRLFSFRLIWPISPYSQFVLSTIRLFPFRHIHNSPFPISPYSQFAFPISPYSQFAFFPICITTEIAFFPLMGIRRIGK